MSPKVERQADEAYLAKSFRRNCKFILTALPAVNEQDRGSVRTGSVRIEDGALDYLAINLNIQIRYLH